MSSSLEYLINNKLKSEDLDVEVEFLIEDFLVKNTLICFYAKAAQGKSWFTLAVCLYLLENKKIEECLYLDMDNGVTVLKDRNLDTILEKYSNFHYIHRSKFKESPRELLKSLANEAKNNPGIFENKLFIFDSMRDFTLGRDITTDKDVNLLISELQSIRDGKGTVIFLHHTTKDSKANEYKGATGFRDGIDISYFLASKRNNNILDYSLYVDKDRLCLEDCAFKLNTKTLELESENLLITSVENQTEKLFIEEAIKYLESVKSKGVKQPVIIKDLSFVVAEKTARKYLHAHAGRFWIMKKFPKENNAVYYYPLDIDNKDISSSDVPTLPNELNP